MSSNIRGALLALLAFGIYATHDALIKSLGATYSPIQVLFFVTLLGFPFVALQLMMDRQPGHLWPARPWLVFLRSAMVVGGAVLGFTAFMHLPMTTIYALIFAAPLLITIMAVPVLGERVGWHRGAAVALGLVGVLVALRPGFAEITFAHFCGLGASVCIAGIGITTRLIGTGERPAVLMLVPMMMNVVLMSVLMPSVYVPPALTDLGILAIVAVMAWAAGLVLIAAYSNGEASTIAPMQYSQMIWGTLYGALFFDEWPDAMTILGAAIIIGSGIYIVWRERSGGHSQQKPVLRAPTRGNGGLWQRLAGKRR